MVQADQHAGEDEERIGEFDNREAPQVAGVDEVRDYAEQREGQREAVN